MSWRRVFASIILAGSLAACGGDELPSNASGDAATSSSSSSAAASTTGSGGASASSSRASASSSSSGGGGGTSKLEGILARLRADRDKALLEVSREEGWPVDVEGGALFVNTDASLTKVAGDHDAWAGTDLTADAGFSWVVAPIGADEHYKFTDGATFVADPWSRQVNYDDNGEISLAKATAARLERHFQVGDAKLEARTVRVWVPAGPVTRVLYAHDGQNLFDPSAIWGGWHLQDTAPDGMLIVGIDNTAARFDEYTPSVDDISGQMAGGKADDYADFLQDTVRPLVRATYGETGPIGTMGSSLGGLVALLIAERYPDDYAFAASLSGTFGWGSIGDGVHHETVMDAYMTGGRHAFTVYVDSGGGGTTCADSDGDGVDDDDASSSDNYCETLQMKGELETLGWTEGDDLFSWYEAGATHDEASWAARVFRPLGVFADL